MIKWFKRLWRRLTWKRQSNVYHEGRLVGSVEKISSHCGDYYATLEIRVYNFKDASNIGLGTPLCFMERTNEKL